MMTDEVKMRAEGETMAGDRLEFDATISCGTPIIDISYGGFGRVTVEHIEFERMVIELLPLFPNLIEAVLADAQPSREE